MEAGNQLLAPLACTNPSTREWPFTNYNTIHIFLKSK